MLVHATDLHISDTSAFVQLVFISMVSHAFIEFNATQGTARWHVQYLTHMVAHKDCLFVIPGVAGSLLFGLYNED